MGVLTVFSSLSVVPHVLRSSGWPNTVIYIDKLSQYIDIYENTAFGVIPSKRKYEFEMAKDCVFANLKAGDVFIRDAGNTDIIPFIEKMGFPIIRNEEMGSDNATVLRELPSILNSPSFPLDVYAFLELSEGQIGLKTGDELKIVPVGDGENTKLVVSARKFHRFYHLGSWDFSLSDAEIKRCKILKIRVKAVSHGRRLSGSVYQTIIFEIPNEISDLWSDLKT